MVSWLRWWGLLVGRSSWLRGSGGYVEILGFLLSGSVFDVSCLVALQLPTCGVVLALVVRDCHRDSFLFCCGV